MFPKTFIEVGNTLTHNIMKVAETATTTAKTSLSLSTSSKGKLTQQMVQQQQETTTDVLWRNTTYYFENITQTDLTRVIGSSSSSSSSISGTGEAAGVGLNTLDGFETDSPFAYVPPMQRPETIFITILFLIIFIVGVLGNGTLVIIFFRHRSMRNIPNTYILSLSLADLLVIVVCVPLAILVYTTDSWTFGKSMCQITEFFKDVSIGVSVFTLTALSGERYCAIVNPLRKLQTQPLTVITAVSIWLLSISFATPSLIMSDLQHILIDDATNLTIIICTPFGQQRNNSEIYARYVVVAKALVYYLFPLLIIGVLYLMMAHHLHVSAREMPGETLSVQSQTQARARLYVARMVVTFVGVFFICFFPYHLFELWFHLNPTAREDFDEFWHAIRIIGFCTYFLNSCLNPVALYCVSKKFRTHFQNYLFCCCVERPTRHRQHSTATRMMDTSIMNMSTRSTTNFNRASSVHFNNAYCTGGGGGVGVGDGGGGCNGNNNANGLGRACNHRSFRSQPRHSVLQHQHNGTSVVTASGKGVSIGVDNGRIKSANAVAQSGVILNEKR